MSELRVTEISKQFKGKEVVKKVSLNIFKNEVVGLLGPNGAGKTTSFYMIVGLTFPDSGKIEVNNIDISNKPIHERSRLGLSYLPQEPSIFKQLTVEQNILIALEAYKYDSLKKINKLESLLGDFGIENIRYSLGVSLSGGERRRVEIARSLAGSPDFLLLDEPFAGIDPIAVSDIQTIIKGVKDRGIGILITDHNVRETLGICDRCYLLREGAVELEGTSEELVSNEMAQKFYFGEDFKL